MKDLEGRVAVITGAASGMHQARDGFVVVEHQAAHVVGLTMGGCGTAMGDAVGTAAGRVARP